MLIASGCESNVADNPITPANNDPTPILSSATTVQPEINPINEMSAQQLEELKPVVNNLFTQYLENEEKSSVPATKRIKDFKIHDDIQILKNSDHVYFIIAYDTLAASKDFVLAGGGELNVDGWINSRGLYVVIEMNDGQYQIKQLSSGP